MSTQHATRAIHTAPTMEIPDNLYAILDAEEQWEDPWDPLMMTVMAGTIGRDDLFRSLGK
jgi:hypothetical protein